MSSRTFSELKKENSRAFSPILAKKPDRASNPKSANGGHDTMDPGFGHNFSNIRVTSGESFKQSCPLSLSSPTYCPFGGACHTCPARIQTKPIVGQPGDKYEQEADRVAGQVMRMSESQPVHKTRISGANRASYANEPRSATHLDVPFTVPPIVHEVLRSPGQPLDATTRAFMEPRFGHDFSHVRACTNASTAHSARAGNGHATTVDHDAILAVGQHAPGRGYGRSVVGHESTDRVALRCGMHELSDKPPLVRAPDTAERQAETAAGAATRSESVTPRSGGTGWITGQGDVGALDAGATASVLPGCIPRPSPVPGSCKVNSFRMKFKGWAISWPGFFSDRTTIQLPVEFELVLDKAASRADCVIGQEKLGRNESCKSNEFKAWTSDSGIGYRHWWDGKKWNAGRGRWGGWFSEYATFHDAPGFSDIEKSCYPLYRGGLGRKGHFRNRTYVNDLKTGKTVRTLSWGLLIDYPAPKKGRHYFYT